MNNKSGHAGFTRLRPATFATDVHYRNSRLIGKFASAYFLIALCTVNLTVNAIAAENLRLREGISFYQDIDSGFPIKADKMDDVSVGDGKPSLIFFGASDDLNTNRQAKRLVDLYYQLNHTHLKFILIDVDHPPNKQAADLIKKYYRGYIPTQVIFDSHGHQIWSQTGEAENRVVLEQLHKVL
jgi:hypothetical protein